MIRSKAPRVLVGIVLGLAACLVLPGCRTGDRGISAETDADPPVAPKPEGEPPSEGEPRPEDARGPSEKTDAEPPRPPDRGVPRPPEEDPGPLDARGKATTCELHDQALLEDTVEIVYGLPLPERPEDVAAKRLFPNARTEVWAGTCVVGAARLARVRYCPACRAARQSYLERMRK